MAEWGRSSGFDENLVEVFVELIRFYAKGKACMGLGVHVNHQDRETVCRQSTGKIHRRRGFPAAPFLVDDADRSHGASPDYARMFRLLVYRRFGPLSLPDQT